MGAHLMCLVYAPYHMGMSVPSFYYIQPCHQTTIRVYVCMHLYIPSVNKCIVFWFGSEFFFGLDPNSPALGMLRALGPWSLCPSSTLC